MSDHTHFVSLSICLSIDLAFSHRIFHALKLLPLHPSQSRCYLHCEWHSNLGLICLGIYSDRFRLYFRSIRPTTTPNTVATPSTPLVDFPLARSSLSRTSFSRRQRCTMVLLQKTMLFSLIIISKLQNYTSIVHFHIIFFVRTVYQLWLHSNIYMHCRVYRTHQDFQSHGCSVHTICHDLWTVLLVGVGGAPACQP